MPYYLVFGSVKRPSDFMGGKHLDWGQPPIGVYQADSAADACQSAARDAGQMATYFAVEGTPWGVDLLPTPATQLGRSDNAMERMARHLDRIDDLEAEKQRLLEAAAKAHGDAEEH